MKLGPGDTVSFLNEKGRGVITKLLTSSIASVLLDDGMEIPYPLKQLVLVKASPDRKPVEKPQDKSEIKKDKLAASLMAKRKKENAPAKRKYVPELEVDLHIEELVDSVKGLNNSQILDIQLRYFQRKLEEALAAHARKIVFIHGVGTGRLKFEMVKILEGYGSLRFHDASYSKYGWGATEVILPGN